jgi:Na+-transporting methylmalonyl-CoA/oxaloacetate decarboxylase gamma subunit
MTYFDATLGFASRIGYFLAFLSILLFLTAIIAELASSRRNKYIQDPSSAITDTKYTPTIHRRNEEFSL